MTKTNDTPVPDPTPGADSPQQGAPLEVVEVQSLRFEGGLRQRMQVALLLSRTWVIRHWVISGLVVLVVGYIWANWGPKNIRWTEQVQLQSGEVLTVRRTALAQPFGQIGGGGGWENEGMTVEVISPAKLDIPQLWSAQFVPILFDRDPVTQEWVMVATFYSCTSWYNLGRPKLPYTEYRFKNGQWVQQAFSEKFVGREANMLTSIRSSGEPNHTLASKALVMSNTNIARKYRHLVAKWQTNC